MKRKGRGREQEKEEKGEGGASGGTCIYALRVYACVRIDDSMLMCVGESMDVCV